MTQSHEDKIKEKEYDDLARKWNNIIPNFNDKFRNNLNTDAELILNYEQLGLNKDLHRSIKINNYLNIFMFILNVILGMINIYLFIKNN